MADGSVHAPARGGADTGPGTKLCLRVLAGANQGASLPLADGLWVIGSGPDADLTFAEPALAANQLSVTIGAGKIRIAVAASGLRLGTEELPAGTERDLPPLAPLTIGRTVFALGPADAEWAAVGAAPAPQPEPASVELPATLLVQAASTAVTNPGETPADATVEPVATAAPPSRPRRLSVLLAGLAALVIAVSLVAGWLAVDWGSPVADGPDPLVRARGAIATLRLPDLTADLVNGRIVITGRVPGDEQRREIANALRRAGVVADLRVRSDAALIEQITTVLKGLGIEAGVVVNRTGEVTLVGYASEDAKVEAALERLRRDVPGIGTIDDQVATAERARRDLEQMLAAAGLADALKIGTATRAVTVSGSLDTTRAAGWTKAAADFRDKYGDRIRLEAKITPWAAISPRGVRFGSNGYIIMQDGRQLRVGDALGATGTVTAIEPRRLRLRTANGELLLPYAQTPYWIVEDAGE